MIKKNNKIKKKRKKTKMPFVNRLACPMMPCHADNILRDASLLIRCIFNSATENINFNCFAFVLNNDSREETDIT